MSALLQDPLLSLRPMTTDDVKAVMGIEEASYDFPWTKGIMRDCLRVGYCCWVVCLGERVAGYGIMSVAAGECHILNLCIHPEMRSKGLGRHLLVHLLRLAQRHRADAAFLEVRVSNASAIELYRSLGFNEVGLRRGYYPAEGGREDAVVFALSPLSALDTSC